MKTIRHAFCLEINTRKRGLFVAQEPVQDLRDTVRAVFPGNDPIELSRIMGAKQPGDVVALPPCTFAVREEKFEELMRSGVSGLRCRKALVLGEDYSIIGFGGRIGPSNDCQSKVKVDGEMKYLIGLFFDWSTWDGSDCSVPENTAQMIVTDNAMNAFETILPKWFVFTPLEHFEQPF